MLSLNEINQLIFVMEMNYVFSEVEIESLNIIQINSMPYLNTTLIRRKREQSMGLRKQQCFIGYCGTLFILRSRAEGLLETKLAY
jgi:hypothetical protein